MLVLLFLTVLPTITIGWFVHNIELEDIREERIKAVGQVADAKHTQLAMVLARANDRAKLFLANLSAQCNTAKFDPVCATKLIESYLASENARGATLHRKGGSGLSVGTPAVRNLENITFKTGQLAQFSGTGAGNNLSYFIPVAEPLTGLQLEISYPSTNLQPVFDRPSELGESGETFLADGEGYFATHARYPSMQGHDIPIHAHPMQACLNGKSAEMLDMDYRDAAIIHGFRPVPEFGSACIMAHADQAEAFAPLKLLKKKLIISISFFNLFIIIVALFMAKSIARPIKQLTATARAISGGDFAARVNVKGGDEIAELGATFNEMTQRLHGTYQQLLQDKERMRATIENALDAVVQVNDEGAITGWTSQAEKIFGWSREEAVGRAVHETIIPLKYREAHVQGMKHFLLSGEGPILNSRIEITGLHRDGHEFPIELSIAAIKMDDKHEFSAFIRDLTERKRAEHQLNELTMHLQSATEEERTRIARELHDELGQSMTALRFDLKWLGENIDAQRKDVHEKLQGINDLVGRTVDSIRRISEDLRPGMLDDLGLAAAIESHVARFVKQSCIACDLSMSHADFDLDDQVATALFRLVQEALTNVARHSGANHVIIRLQEIEGNILLIVQDNGRGLPPVQDIYKKTYGLLGMRERVKMLGGTLDVFNEKGFGARIEACVPKHVKGIQ